MSRTHHHRKRPKKAEKPAFKEFRWVSQWTSCPECGERSTTAHRNGCSRTHSFLSEPQFFDGVGAYRGSKGYTGIRFPDGPRRFHRIGVLLAPYASAVVTHDFISVIAPDTATTKLITAQINALLEPFHPLAFVERHRYGR